MMALIELAKPDYLHPCNVIQNAKSANLLLWHFCIFSEHAGMVTGLMRYSVNYSNMN